MAICSHVMDVGALTPLLWLFEEREKLMEFYERVSGARFHTAYVRPGGVALDLPIGLLNDINAFCTQFASRLDEVEELVTGNRIWKIVRDNAEFPMLFGSFSLFFSVPSTLALCPPRRPSTGASLARCSAALASPGTCASRSPTMVRLSPGHALPLLTLSFAAYDLVDFDIPVGVHGDCYDRYNVRMQEMRQSLRIIHQCINQVRP